MSQMRTRVYPICDALNMHMILTKESKVRGEQTFTLPWSNIEFRFKVTKTLDFGTASTTLILDLAVKDSESSSDLVMMVDSTHHPVSGSWLALTLMSKSKLGLDFKWEDAGSIDELYKVTKPAVVASFTLNGEEWEEAA